MIEFDIIKTVQLVGLAMRLYLVKAIAFFLTPNRSLFDNLMRSKHCQTIKSIIVSPRIRYVVTLLIDEMEAQQFEFFL
jgi:hypothetical protein